MHKSLRMIISKKTMVPLVAVLTALFLAACSGGSSGGGGSSSDVRALSLPDRITLTNVEDSSSSSRALALTRGAYGDAGTDYSNAVKHTWVDDTDALDMVNDILGVVKDTSYADFINDGPYKALVRQVGESEQSQSGSNTTSTTTEQLMEITVDVSRASNDDPMIVKVWVEEESGPGDQPMLIRGYFTVTQGVSAEYPFGVMTAHFKGTALDAEGNEGDDMFNMAMGVDAEGGNVVIETVEDSEEGGGFEFHTRVQVVANADVTEGNAYIMERETDWETMITPTEWDIAEIAFTDDYFKLSEEGLDTFYSKASLKHRIFNYRLYDFSTGAKLSLSSGFPIRTESNKNGYIGYYGLWTSHGDTVANGAAVTDMDGNEYTVFRAEGKLTKHAKAEMALSEIDGVELSKWECGSGPCQDLIVAWDSATDTFITLGSRNQETGQIVYLTDADAGYHAPVTFDEWDGAWCEPLRAYLRLGGLYFDPDTGTPITPTDTTTFSYHTEQTINPSTAANLTLHTWEFTMDTPITQAVVNSFDTDRNNYWGSTPTEKTYNFVASEMMLKDTGNNAVVLGSDLTIPDGSDLQWGYHIGPLTVEQYNFDSDPFFWEAHNADVYYTWNTGGDEWNQFVTVKDGNGDFIGFDAPVSFSYTHTTANDVNDESLYNNKTFRLEYDGFSVMIPWEYDPSTDEWEPIINIKDGVQMGPTGVEYVIKAVEESLIMEEVTDPAIVFPTNTVGEPSLTYDATKTALVGDLPATAELKVIKGELIE